MAEKGKLDQIEERLRVVEGCGDYAFADMEDLCLVPNMVIPPKFKVLDFDKYKGKMMEACLWGFYGGWIFELQ